MTETNTEQSIPATKKLTVKEILESLGIGKEEAIAKAIGELTSEEKLEFITYVYPAEDDKLALLASIAERYGYSWLHHWVNKKLALRTSLLGWRANQLSAIASEKRREEHGWRIFGFLKRKKEKGFEVEEFE
ncbi:MAG: hypothetical protein QW175_07650 [Candidatus Bathyarchaeia archaeon]